MLDHARAVSTERWLQKGIVKDRTLLGLRDRPSRHYPPVREGRHDRCDVLEVAVVVENGGLVLDRVGSGQGVRRSCGPTASAVHSRLWMSITSRSFGCESHSPNASSCAVSME